MDKNYVKTVLEGIQSTSSTRIQEALLKLRSKVIADENGLQLFRDLGGLVYLVPHLRKPNERILDLSLSILGNCCLDEQTCLAAGKLNIFAPLITVLKTVCRDSIVGRAGRLIGNLAQRPTNAEELHNHGAVSALITLIENRDKNTSYPTLTMAVRALRQLWMVTEKREEMLSLNTVRCIAILLTTECESAGILKSSNSQNESTELRKSQEELISGILKCLGYFTTHATSQCAEQMQGDGRGFQSLVALTKRFESLAMKCLMNLCYLSTCRPLLGIAGMVECLVGILQKNPGCVWWAEGAARALSQLSGESVNRSRLRHCGGLPLLVAAAKDDINAMRALLQYVFDDTSFQILVNEGLITLLTDELISYLTTMKLEHNYKEKADSELSQAEDNDSAQDASSASNAGSNRAEERTALYQRRRGPLSMEDELKVVIERDNMMVGFIDAVDSASDDSAPEGAGGGESTHHLKRPRSTTPNNCVRKRSKARSRDWSAGVYWEPKSPEWSCSSRLRSPEVGPLSPCSEGSQAGFSPECKRARWERSPESGFGSGEGAASPRSADYPWSPASSAGPASLFSNNDDSSDSEVSGRYSPVCSEPEAAEQPPGSAVGETPPPPQSQEMEAAQVAFDELAVDDTDIDNDDEPLLQLREERFSIERSSSRIACVLVLLFRVSQEPGGGGGEPAGCMLEPLSGEQCLNALLDYVERCRKPMGRAARILTRLLSNALCLVNVLKHKLALRLHRMSVTSVHPLSQCQQCKQIRRLSVKLLAQLTILAESSYGIGEISYQLLRGTPHMKETLTMTLPYIVKADRTLKKLFIECRALGLLFGALAQDSEHLPHYVTALGKIAANIRIKDPKTLENKFSDHVVVTYDPVLDNLSKEEIVIFELDDSSTVPANKVFLCQNSDVFSAMLMGRFKESIEECVRIRNVTKQGLEYLLTLLHLGLNDSKSDVKVFPMADKLETNLEVLLLADRFLFDKLKELLSSAILQFELSPETADRIYVWSLSEGMGFLCVEAVAYLLTGRMSEAQRTRAFRAILHLQYREQWLDDVKTIIVRQLEGVGYRS